MALDALTSRPRLVALSGPIAGEVVPLAASEATIGRDPSNAICLADRSLSRTHCVLAPDNQSWLVRDTGSANGTFVNGLPVREHALRDGDQIKAGESVFLFVLGAAEREPGGIELQAVATLTATSRLRIEDADYLQSETSADRSSQRVEHDLRTLLHLSTTLGSTRDEGELFQRVLDQIFEAVPADSGAIVLGRSVGEATTGYSRRRVGHAPVPVSRTALAQVLADRVGILSRDTSVSQSFRAAPSIVAAGVGSLLCVPLASRGEILGAIYLTTHDRPGAFDDGHLQLVTAIAAVASIAIDNVRHIAAVEREAELLRADLHLEHSLVGDSVPMRQVYELVARLARSDTTAMIFGETGTGKELAARALHNNSERARHPFVAINCAALTESLLESELFGHERGAFTGAVALKKGKFEVADGGTVFLDELGELAPVLQSKLLRFLQQREFERVGGTRPLRVNVRVIGATNRKLSAEVAAGRFREDLFFRLNVVSITMPALRERRGDIPILARHFVQTYGPKVGRAVRGISAAALQRLEAYDWPGNVRELENAIERAIVLGSSDLVLPEDLPDSLLETPVMPGREIPRFHEAVLETKKRVILDAVRQARHSYVDAARLLGLHPNYLHRVIRNLDLKSQIESEH